MSSLLKLASPVPHNSCQTDYGSFTFKLPNQAELDNLFDYFDAFCWKVLPNGQMKGPFRSKHYEFRHEHSSGIQLEFTSFSSDKENIGQALFTIPGSPWGALDAEERRDLIIDLYKWNGFFRCTRWDPQLTRLEPPITIHEIIDNISAGRLWAAGFGISNQYVDRTFQGVIKGYPTQYLGATTSDVRLRLYDHGAKWDWQVPSLRVEVQLRNKLADLWFRRLAQRCYDQRDAQPLFITAEDLSVKDAVTQHADFRDTSQWEGRPKPRNWRKSAPRSSWLLEMLDHEATPLVRESRPSLGLDQTIEHMVEQYGRKFVLWCMKESINQGVEHEQVWEDFWMRSCAKLKRDDAELLMSEVDPVHREMVKDLFRKMANCAAREAEERAN